MDGTIKKRLVDDVTVFPSIGKVDGDITYGEPFVVKGYVYAKDTVITTRAGVEVRIKTSIIISGDEFDRIHPEDDILTVANGRASVKGVFPYHALTTGYELLEVLL